ncbi:MAG: hypothetical protein HS126_11125 [Anaerolineales bacterium]|nr:hypothetical protein [Anaerolineales bacterium]
MAKKKLSRDQKRAQKKKRQARRSQAPLDPGQRILNRLEKAGLGSHKLMRNPPGQVKMSEVLRDFVAPYWHIPDTEEAMRKLLTTALVAWNTALMPQAEQAGALDQIATALPAEAREDFYAIVREMIERKNKHFAAYDRLILDYELVDRGNDFHITVVSRMPSEDEQGAE